MSRTKNPWPAKTIWGVESVHRARFAAEFARFDKHRKRLLDHLRTVSRRGSAVRPFEDKPAWEALCQAAYWYFLRQTQKFELKARTRKERLHDCAKALDDARNHLLNATQDAVGWDLWRGWCGKKRISPSSLMPGKRGRFEIPIAGEIKDLAERLDTLGVAARIAAGNIRPKRGPSLGAGILSPQDVLALAEVYRKSTCQNPHLSAGPFAEFVEKFLIAAGRGNATANDYVVEMFHYLRGQLRKESRQLGRSVHRQYIPASRE